MSVFRFAGRPLFAVLLTVVACGEDSGSADPSGGVDEPSSGVDGDKPAGDEGTAAARPDAAVVTTRPRADAGATEPPGNEPATPDGGTSGADGGTSNNEPPAKTASCLDDITKYDGAGPFKYAAQAAGKVKFTVPEVPAGCKVPVVHLANGTGASCSSYKAILDRLASHGFLAACYDDPQTGAGSQGLMALQAAFEMFPDLVDKKIGSTGHSQGGQGAFTVLQLAEAEWGDEMTYAGLAMEPASGYGSQPTGGTWQSVYAKIKSPMFMFSGTADTLVSAAWVQRGFDAMAKTNETYNWSAIGATHVPVPTAATQQVSIPWFRWKLLGDNAACQAFKALPATDAWDEVKVQNAIDCK